MTSDYCQEIVEALERVGTVDELHEICLCICIYLGFDHSQEEIRRPIVNDPTDLDKVELTGRERECLFWAAEGKTSWETAKILHISKRTVIFHVQNATRKLNAANRQNAIARAVVLGLVTPQLS